MISHKYKCIFVHIRKSAGSSIRNAMQESNHFLSDGMISPNWDEAVNGEYEKYYKFCIIRNPWDRFISGWKYCWSTRGQSVKDVLLNMPKEDLRWNILNPKASYSSRENYLLGLIEKEKRLSSLSAVKGESGNNNANNFIKARNLRHDFMHITVPQTHYFYKNGNNALDFIGSLESIENDFHELRKILGIDVSVLSVVNSSKSKKKVDYRDCFDEESLEIFYNLFKDDIELLGYDFSAGPGVPPKFKL